MMPAPGYWSLVTGVFGQPRAESFEFGMRNVDAEKRE